MKDQIRKRQRREAVILPAGTDSGPHPGEDDATRRSVIEQAPEGRPDELEGIWDAEWRNHLMVKAVADVKPRFSAKQWQVFDLSVLKEWPAGDVAKSLGMNAASVYLAKHRVSAAVKKAVARLEREMEPAV